MILHNIYAKNSSRESSEKQGSGLSFHIRLPLPQAYINLIHDMYRFIRLLYKLTSTASTPFQCEMTTPNIAKRQN